MCFAVCLAVARRLVGSTISRGGSAPDQKSMPKCNSLSGFFVLELPGARIVVVQPKDALCQASDGANPVRLFFGCGKLQSYTYDATAPGCAGFNRVLDCVGAWDCDTGVAAHPLTNVSDATPTDGLLCCK